MEIGEQLQIIENLTNDEWSSPNKSLQTLKLELFDTIRCFYNTQLHSYLQNYDPTLRWACDLAAGCPFADQTCAFCEAASEPFNDDLGWESSANSPSSDSVDGSASDESAFDKADATFSELTKNSCELYRALKKDLESLSEEDRALIDPSFVDSLISSLADLSGETHARTNFISPEKSHLNDPDAVPHDGGNRIRGDPPKGGDAHPPTDPKNHNTRG